MMKMEDIRALRGQEVAVEFPVDEAGQGYGSSRGIVRATVVEAPHEFTEMAYAGRGKTVRGARLRLAAPFRRMSGDEAGFAELPAGFEFDAQSRQVLREWGGSDRFRSSGSDHSPSDDEREAIRAQRYAEQDIVRERLSALGLRESTRGVGAAQGCFTLRGADVIIDRATAAEAFRRADPVRVAGEAIDEMKKAAGPEEWEALKLDVLAEVAEGLAVSDADIEPSPEDQYAQDFDEATDRAMRSGGAGPV
jgi:hypothetical protein